MRVTLDWDSAEEQQANLEQARDAFEDRPYEIRRSSSGNGWHFIGFDAANDTRSGFERSLNLREVWGDDPKRRNLDEKRYNRGSPFLQVLYRRKYMDRTDFPDPDDGYTTGNVAEVIEQNESAKVAPESERVKGPDGEINYNRLLELVRERTGLTQAEVADKTHLKTYAKEDGGISRSTVSAYERGQRDVTADSLRRWLRRIGRSRGIGHFAETDDGGKAVDDVKYVDPEQTRRTLVEYVDVPMDWDVGGDDREYGLLNIHTGTYNPNHSDQQLHRIHDGEGGGVGIEKPMKRRGVADQALAVLSPTNPKTGTSLELDDQNESFRGISGWTREMDSLNYEKELLDDGEKDVYIENLPNSPEKPDNPGEQPLFEIILWDEDMSTFEWHCIGIWAGSDPSDAIILKDEGIGSWNAA